MTARRSIVLRALQAGLILVLAAPPIAGADPGDVDTTFGTAGMTFTGFGFTEGANTDDVGTAIAVDNVGRVLMAGWSSGQVGNGLAVARYLSNGDLDPAFGHDGRAVIRLGFGGGSSSVGLVVDASGRVLVLGSLYGGLGQQILATRLLDDGSRDPTFGEDGIVLISVGPTAWAEDAALDASGRILIVGGALGPGASQYDSILVRLSADGALDATFGTGGVATIDLGALDFGRAIGINAAGIYIAGGSNGDFLVARYTDAGVLDPAYGSGGLTLTDLGGSDETAAALAIDTLGRVVIGGTTLNPSANLGLARYDATGNLDTTFDGDGIVVTDVGPAPGYAEGIRGLAIDGSGRIVGSGWAHPGDTFDGVAARWLEGGSLDTSFAGDGIAEIGLLEEDRAEGVVVVGTTIVVGGYEAIGRADFRLTRLDDAGLPDATWGGDGVVVTNMGSGHPRTDVPYEIALLPDGRLVAAGSWTDGSNADVALAMYDTAGALDPSFGGDGRIEFDLGGYDEAYGVAVQPGLGVVTAGYADGELWIARVGFDGVLDPAFGTGGIVQAAVGSLSYAWDVAVDGSGRIVLTGESDSDVLVARLLADGSLDATFGTGGLQVVAMPGYRYGASIAFDAADRLVIGVAGGLEGLDVIRLTDAGVLDPSFAGDGIATIDSPVVERTAEAVLDPAGNIVVAGHRGDAMIVARLDPNGVLDPSFDDDGVLDIPQIGSSDSVEAIEVQPDGAIVLLGRTQSTDGHDWVIGRLLGDGAFDSSFHGGAPVILDLGGSDMPFALALDAAGRIVVAGSGGRDEDFAIARYEATVGPDTASGTATPGDGGSASTGNDPTSSDPVETSVVVPPGTTGGPISIIESETPTIPPPSGYEALGLEVQISAPAGTEVNPLELSFTFDKDTALAAGVDELTIQILRNGVPVAGCLAVGPISPDPCVVERARTPDGDIRVRVLTSAASAWSGAVRLPFSFSGFLQPVDSQPIQNTAKAGAAIPVKFRLGGDQGLDIFAATYPHSVGVGCVSNVPQDVIEQTSTAGSSGLTFDSATGTYTYVWKTEKSWAATCRQLVLRFADGTFHMATFRFTK